MKEIPGYQVDEVAAVSRMASLGVRPYCRTRNSELYTGTVLTDEGDTNENIT